MPEFGAVSRGSTRIHRGYAAGVASSYSLYNGAQSGNRGRDYDHIKFEGGCCKLRDKPNVSISNMCLGARKQAGVDFKK
jgi:hypothetical protein